jgi:chromatin assembly factor 1 subunit B
MPITAQSIQQKLYGDELATNFFRRLTFSPDGGLLLTPAGQIDEPVFPPLFDDDPSASIPRPRSGTGQAGPLGDAAKSTVYIYSRANFSRPPIAHLPGHKSTTVAVRFSPIFYELRPLSATSSAPPQQVVLDHNDPAPVHVSIHMPPPPVPSSVTSDRRTSASAAPTSTFALPYRLMYAVAAQDSVLLYDTQQSTPIAVFRGLHYSAFTDVAW